MRVDTRRLTDSNPKMSTISVPAVPVPEFPVRPFTVEEYHRLAEAGILTDEDRVELLEGFVVPKMIHNPPHDTSVKLADEALRGRLPTGWHTRVQSAVTIGDSEPEPDVAVVRGSIRDYAVTHPGRGDIGLLVEVAESSLAKDRRKRQVYARTEIANYWIVDLEDRQVEVYSDPISQEEPSAYKQQTIYRPGESIPLCLDGQHLGDIPVDDLLP